MDVLSRGGRAVRFPMAAICRATSLTRSLLLRRSAAPLAASRAARCSRLLSTAAPPPPPPPQPPQPAGGHTGAIIEIKSAAEFEPLVMAASQQAPPVGGPVIVDFYADWCGPCKQLTPALEKLVNAADGAVRLAKVNVDALPELAQALQVKSLPTVMAVHKGKLVDSFQGALADAQLKAWVDKVVALAGGPGVGKRALEVAAELLEAGQLPEATQAYADLTALPEFAASAHAGLALCALADDNLSMASEMVASLHKKFPADLEKPDVKKAVSKVALAADADDGTGRSLAELRAALEAEPLAHATRLELAQKLMGTSESEAAVDELLFILRKTARKKEDAAAGEAAGAAKEYLFKVFDVLGPESDLSKAGRRRLANILLV